MSYTLNDVQAVAHKIVHQPTSLETSRFVSPWQAEPTRRLEYQNHPQRRRMYVHPEHGHPSNLVGMILAELDVPQPLTKYNDKPFSVDLHPAYLDLLNNEAVTELVRMWQADVAGQNWVTFVK